jgi:hypothetical protein
MHSRMPLVPTPAGLKRLQAWDQCHSSRAFTFVPVHSANVNCVKTLKDLFYGHGMMSKKAYNAVYKACDFTCGPEVKACNGPFSSTCQQAMSARCSSLSSSPPPTTTSGWQWHHTRYGVIFRRNFALSWNAVEVHAFASGEALSCV